MVAKLLAWEDSGQGLSAPAALVADNPDAGGDFEADTRTSRRGRPRAEPARSCGPEIGSLDAAGHPGGARLRACPLMSYVGHGGAAVWAARTC